MPPVKLEIFPLPDLREIEDRLWFKIKLDDKAKWKPQIWQPPALDEHIQTVLSDKALTVFDDRVKRLSAACTNVCLATRRRSVREMRLQGTP